MVKKRYRADRDAIDRKRLPLAVKVFGVLCLVAGGATAVLLTITIVTMVLAFTSGNLDVEASTATVVIFVAETVLYTALAAMFAIFGIRLLRNKRKHAAHGTEAMIFILAAIIICSIMLNGLGANVIPHAVVAVFLIVMQSYLDPALAGERELRRKLRDMETREQAEDGTLGLDPTGTRLHHPELLQPVLDIRGVQRARPCHRNRVSRAGSGPWRLRGPCRIAVRALLAPSTAWARC